MNKKDKKHSEGETHWHALLCDVKARSKNVAGRVYEGGSGWYP